MYYELLSDPFITYAKIYIMEINTALLQIHPCWKSVALEYLISRLHINY